MRKGMALPINMVVILAVAMLILVVVGAFFSGYFGGGTLDIALNQACNQFVTIYNCDETKLDRVTVMYTLPGKSDQEAVSLKRLCELKGYNSETCMRVCGCSAGLLNKT